jgi:hypothetical protein
MSPDFKHRQDVYETYGIPGGLFFERFLSERSQYIITNYLNFSTRGLSDLRQRKKEQGLLKFSLRTNWLGVVMGGDSGQG